MVQKSYHKINVSFKHYRYISLRKQQWHCPCRPSLELKRGDASQPKNIAKLIPARFQKSPLSEIWLMGVPMSLSLCPPLDVTQRSSYTIHPSQLVYLFIKQNNCMYRSRALITVIMMTWDGYILIRGWPLHLHGWSMRARIHIIQGINGSTRPFYIFK